MTDPLDEIRSAAERERQQAVDDALRADLERRRHERLASPPQPDWTRCSLGTMDQRTYDLWRDSGKPPLGPPPPPPASPSLTEKQVETIAYDQARQCFVDLSETIFDLDREVRDAMRAEMTRDREAQTQRVNELEGQVLTLRREIADMREARSVSDIPKFLGGTNGDARLQ